MQKFAVIMAGGVGSRFWPRSRKLHPKQLLNIFGDNTMIQETVERLNGYIDQKNIFVITNKVQKALIEEQLPEIPKENIVAEPVGRNTAPCVGLSAVLIKNIDPESVIITLPADHLIQNREKFINELDVAVNFAYTEKKLVTFGINPTRPDTGYGYIKYGSEIKNKVFKVLKFEEKPTAEIAQNYVDSGEYLWNSGMFIWRTDVIMEEFHKYKKNIYDDLKSIASKIETVGIDNALLDIYPGMESISIDYAIMEKSELVHTVKGTFDWSDVGSWETVYSLSSKDENGNSANGKVFTKDTQSSFIYSPNKFTAVIGEKNLIVIDTPDALLICNRENVQDVRDVVKHLEENDEDSLL